MTDLTTCVFCASSEDAGPGLRKLAAELGAALAERGHRIVYGGGGIGLMGELARAAMAAGGEVIGVIPQLLTQRERATPDITELHIVDTLRERKDLMDRLSNGFCILPGGIGTLEELMEILTLRQLGFHDRPIVILDPDGFWDPLRGQLDAMVEAGLAGDGVRSLAVTIADIDAAIDALEAGARSSRHGGTALGG